MLPNLSSARGVVITARTYIIALVEQTLGDTSSLFLSTRSQGKPLF